MTRSAALSRSARTGCKLALLIAGCATDPVHGATYTVQDLGTLGGTYSYATGINASGQTVGSAGTTSDFTERAFRTTGTGPITGPSLGTLGGSYSTAYGINASGQAVGSAAISFDMAEHAFRTAANGPINAPGTDLFTLGGTYSRAYGINASGQTVGESTSFGDAVTHAFRTAANGPINAPGTDLFTLGGSYSAAKGINVSGQTVGESTLAGDLFTHAFRTTATGSIAGTDLGTLGGNYSAAKGINASGQTVGESTLAGELFTHAFRTTATGSIAGTDLGTLGGTYSTARGINTSGQTIGESSLAGDLINHAFFVDVTGPMADLNALIYAGSGWELTSAFGINDVGQIVGNGLIGGQAHAFRLSKVTVATWVGGGMGSSLSGPANWNPNGAPLNNGTAALVFGGNTRLNPTADNTAWNVASIAFDNTAGAFTIGGPQVVTVGSGGIVNNDGDLQTITAPLTLSETQTFDAAAGALSVGSVALGGRALTLTGAANLTVGSVSGAGSVTKTGAGALTLTGAQAFDTLTASTGVTNVNGSFTSGTVTVNANAAVNFNASQTLAALNIGDGVEVTFGDGLPFAPEPGKSGAALVPEPGSIGLLLIGALGLLARRRFSLKETK